MLLEIKRINLDAIDLEEAVATLAISRMIVNEFSSQSIAAPDWITERVAELEKEVKKRTRDYLEATLKSLKARKESLKTAEQKRQDIDAEIAKIEASING